MRKHTKDEKERAKLNSKAFICEGCSGNYKSKESLRKHKKFCKAKQEEIIESEIAAEFSPIEDNVKEIPIESKKNEASQK